MATEIIRLFKPSKSLKLFYCYAHEDKDERNELDRHLSSLKRSQQLASWSDQDISPGADWETHINQELMTAHIILLLISANFMASDYCYGEEMQRALQRHEAGEVRVVPILLRDVDWEDAPFSKLQMLPSDAKPIEWWQRRDDAFADIARNLRKVIKELQIALRTKEEWLEEGDLCYERSYYEEALHAYERAMKLDPTFAVAYSGKSNVLSILERYDDALHVCDQAIKLDPTGTTVAAHLDLKHYEELIPLYPSSEVLLCLLDTLGSSHVSKVKMHILCTFLDSSIGEKDDNVQDLLHRVQLTPSEQISFLEHYGPRYLQDSSMPATISYILNMFGQLGSSDLSQDKMRVLVAFLDSPIGSNDSIVQDLLQWIQLTPSEQAPFLERYGPCYLQDNTMLGTGILILKMFGQLGASDLSQDKMRVLSAFLDSPVGKSDRIVQNLLQMVQFTPSEQVSFLERYGPRYLLDGNMPATITCILNMFEQLGSIGLSQEKMRVLSAFLGSPMGNSDSIVPNLLQRVQLTPSEQVPLLERYGPRYLPDNNMPRTAMHILSTFELLGSNNLSQEKLHVLFSWLNSSQLTRWFNASTLKGEANLSKVLNVAHLHDEESDLFFQLFGKKFIELYPSSETLLCLFDSYGKSGKLRLDMLFSWLECDLEEKVLGRLLTVASLSIGECTIFFQRFGKKFISRYPSSETLLCLFDSYGKSGKLRLDMLFSWLECDLEESVLGRLLTAASLNAEECSLFFQNFGEKFIELYPASKNLLDLFARYVSSGLDITVKGKKNPLRIDLLYIWLSCKVDINVLERVLNASNLNIDERRRVLLVSGKYYLGRYPQALTLNRYIPEFLEYLRTVDLAIFKSVSPEKPSLAESFLGFLKSRQNLSSGDQELYDNWYTVAQFIRKPSTFSDESQRIGVSIGWLLEYQIELEANCISLIRELASVCLSDEDELTNRVTILSGVLTPEDLKTLLYCIAESARDGMLQGSCSKTLLEPCTQLAFRFKPTIQKETDTEDFVKKFLDILLFYTEKEILKALDRRTQQWPDGFKTEWQHYIRKRRTNPARLFLNPRFSTE